MDGRESGGAAAMMVALSDAGSSSSYSGGGGGGCADVACWFVCEAPLRRSAETGGRLTADGEIGPRGGVCG